MSAKKKRNPQDATMRNVRSLRAGIVANEDRIEELVRRVSDLEVCTIAEIRRAFIACAPSVVK